MRGHKILDCIGDLPLVGCDLVGYVEDAPVGTSVERRIRTPLQNSPMPKLSGPILPSRPPERLFRLYISHLSQSCRFARKIESAPAAGSRFNKNEKLGSWPRLSLRLRRLIRRPSSAVTCRWGPFLRHRPLRANPATGAGSTAHVVLTGHALTIGVDNRFFPNCVIRGRTAGLQLHRRADAPRNR